MKKVLTVVRSLSIGGTQRHAVNVAIDLRKRGWSSDVIVLDERGPREEVLRNASVGVYNFGDSIGQYDLILAHTHLEDERINRIVKEAKRDGGIAININVFGRPYYISGSLFDSHAHISEGSRWRCLKRGEKLGIDHGNHHVAYYGVDIDFFRPPTPSERQASRSWLNLSDDNLVWLRIGQPFDAKWDPVIVDAFERASKENFGLKMVLVGAPPTVRKRIAQLEPNLQSRVILRDPTSNENEIRSYYWAADLFAHVSHIGESFGMVLLEAMLCALPVVTKIDPGQDIAQVEFIIGGRNGQFSSTKAGFISLIGGLDINAANVMRGGCIDMREMISSSISIAAATNMLLAMAKSDPLSESPYRSSEHFPRTDYNSLFEATSWRFRIMNNFLNSSLYYRVWEIAQGLKTRILRK